MTDIQSINHRLNPFVLPTDLIVIESVPTTWKDMLASSNKQKWLTAIDSELKSHSHNDTFKETSGLLKDYIALGSRWIFTRKQIQMDNLLDSKPVLFSKDIVKDVVLITTLLGLDLILDKIRNSNLILQKR